MTDQETAAKEKKGSAESTYWYMWMAKTIKNLSKIFLDSFLTVTTVLENWMLILKTRRVRIQNIPGNSNKSHILILPSILNLRIKMQNMWQY